MSKRKTLRRLSSAALLSLAMYSQTMAPGWTKEVRAFENNNQTRIERSVDIRKKAGEVSIGRGIIKNVNGSTLVVADKKGNKDFSVIVGENTKILSKSSVKVFEKDLNIGHEVNVLGKVENGDSSSIRASVIKDLSLVIRNGQFKGIVSSIENNVLNILIRGNIALKIALDNETKITDKTGNRLITTQDIKVGNIIKAKGSFNGSDNTLSKVVSIKNMSLPVN